MASYFIAQVSIQDREAYQAYEQGFMAILDQYGGQLVSVDEQPLVLEGNWGCTRTVLLKFETATFYILYVFCVPCCSLL